MQNEQTGNIEKLMSVADMLRTGDKSKTQRWEDKVRENIKKGKMVHPDFVKPDGSPIPKEAIIFKVGELIDIKGYTYRLVYLNEKTLIFEPVKPEDILPGDGKE